MTLSKQFQRLPAKTYPPFLIGLAGLIIAVAFSCFMGLTAFQSDKASHEAATLLQTMWEERVSSHSSVDQDKIEIEVEQDKLKLAQLVEAHRQLYQLISIASIGFVMLSLACFFGFRYGILLPLRKIEASSRSLLEHDLKGHIWGMDRDDVFGSLARSISDIRKATVDLSDMVIQTDSGEQHVRFEGRSAAVFGALIADLQKTVGQLTQHSQTLETVSKNGQENVQSLGDITAQQTQKIETTLENVSTQWATTHSEWEEKLSALFHQNNQVAGQSRQLVDQFTRDMHSLNQIAAATGSRVATTLQILSASDRDIKAAAQQSLQSSSTFAKQTSDLMEKLQAATNLLRASGKVMSETTQAARTRLNEAINSVSSHDQAIRAFLGDTEEKTDRITSLLEDVSRSAVQASETVSTFDQRMALFEEKSNTAFGRIDESADAMGAASNELNDAHRMMQGSLESMNGHTEMLARILTSVRDEYASFSTEWKTNLADTAPVFAQLRDASDGLQRQLRDEWSVYAQQSRELLAGLEQDVRTMNGRTEQVTKDTEKLISHLSQQTQRVSDNANHFDLHVANISLRLDEATAMVKDSNKSVVETTCEQIKTIHTSVQDMAQRLGILSQLTGTLGAVAGQLGQIVPVLGDSTYLQRLNAAQPAPATLDPAVMARFEDIGNGFSASVENIRTEFDGIRTQVARWVEMLTGGYKNLADQINTVDGSIEHKIASLSQQIENATAAQISAAAAIASVPPAPALNLGEELIPAMRLIHDGLEKGYTLDAQLSNDLQQLKADLNVMAQGIITASTSLQRVGTLVEQGFERIEGQEPVKVTVDATRVEGAARALEQLLKTLQGHSDIVVGKLGHITQRLEGTSEKLQSARLSAPMGSARPFGEISTQPAAGFSEKANLDQLHQQIENISAMLDRFSADGTRFINAMGEAETLTPDKSKAFIETVMSTIIRLHHIAESIEKIGGNTPPDGSHDSKTG